MSTVLNSGVSVELLPDARKLIITWDDVDTSSFHYVWLRHSARCLHDMLVMACGAVG